MSKVKISYNPEEEMMEIDFENEAIFYGNYTDFSREPLDIANLLGKIGIEVDIDSNLPSIG
jgi:hypothetical protein